MGRLDGRVVATTRAADPGDALVARLLAEGARVVTWPTIATEEPEDARPLVEAARSLQAYDWVAFTSPRAVQALAVHARPPVGGRPRIAAVGDATAAALAKEGWPADVVAGGEGARALAETMDAGGPVRGRRILFPAGSLARSTLEDALRAKGAEVERVEAYRTRMVPPDALRVRADLASGVDVVTFASPSAVQALAEALQGDLPAALGAARVAAIGRTTADALEAR
ncbi:MAG: uroporphyrinogen-III synthase, partial [Gemmatimonadetes bacterium]|nr:uroporphyrinogen-III synthase [Gemmatimonadota bacterium]